MPFTRQNSRNQASTLRRSGALSVAQQEHALDMLRSGMSQQATANLFGVSKNTIAGLGDRHGIRGGKPEPPSTLFERCDALHAMMDAVLAENLGVGKIVEAPVVKAARR